MKRKSQSVELLAKEIQFLEEIATKESKLEEPELQEVYITDQEIIHEMAKEAGFLIPNKVEDYSLFDLNLMRKKHSIDTTSIFVAADEELIALETKKKDYLETRDLQLELNMEDYFKPAKEALEYTSIGIQKTIENDGEEAINLFKKALNIYPQKGAKREYDLNEGSDSIIFNLGKALLNEGYLEEGIMYLINYCKIKADGDGYRNELITKFNLSFTDRNRLENGRYGEILFTQTQEGYSFEYPKNVSYTTLDLPYKLPISLSLEYKDKKHIDLFDYSYVNELIQENNNHKTFELILPLKDAGEFMNFFLGTVYEYVSLPATEKTRLSVLSVKRLLAKKRLITKKPHYYPYEEPFVSYHNFYTNLIVEVKPEDSEAFLSDYSRFIELFILKQKSEVERIDEQIEIAKYERQMNIKWFRSEMVKEFQDRYEYFRHLQATYSELNVYLFNLENNVASPFKATNQRVGELAKNKFWKLLDNRFSRFEEETSIKIEDSELHDLKISIKDESFGLTIEKNWVILKNLVNVDPASAMVRIRSIIYELSSRTLTKLGYGLYEVNGNLMPLYRQLNKLELDSEINKKLFFLRLSANRCAHIQENKREYQEFINDVSKNEVEEHIQNLENIIIYFVKRFEL